MTMRNVYRNVLVLRQVNLYALNCHQGTPYTGAERKVSTSQCTCTENLSTVPAIKSMERIERDTNKEWFIPLTRRSLVQKLLLDESLLTEGSKKTFEQFALALDSAIVLRHHHLLRDLKSLFDPINPDKDSFATRQLNKRELVEQEFWLLQKLDAVLECANFTSISQEHVDELLRMHNIYGLGISVDQNKYDVLKFWVLGRERGSVAYNLWQRFLNFVTRKFIPTEPEYYKRVVVAIRLKKDDKMVLKAFKEIPTNSLQLILPDGQVSMSGFHSKLFGTSLFVVSLTLFSKLVTWLADVESHSILLVGGMASLISLAMWDNCKRKHLAYLNEISRLLYFKNIGNNQELLKVLVDRAEDEIFKQALLSYSFLLANHHLSTREKPDSITIEDFSGLSALRLKVKVEQWVLGQTGTAVDFDPTETCVLLKELGLLHTDSDESLHVLKLDAASNLLPRKIQTLADRVHEYDLTEGYDRSVYDETEREYQAEMYKRRKFGWF